jgi:hypothetical protein
MPSGDHTGNLGGGPGGDPDLRTLPPDLELLPGFHGSPEEGLCALEAVSWMSGLPHSDRPACVCPVLASFLRAMNDHMPHDLRQRLIPFLPSLVGTRDPALAAPRATALAWRAISVFAPIPLAAADLPGPAEALKRISRLDPEVARTAALAAAAEVNDTAWAEAKANGSRYWDINAKVSPALWTAVEMVRLAETLLEQLAAPDDWAARATTAAQIVSATCRLDESAWPLALGALDELLAIGRETGSVVSLADYRRKADAAA